MSLDIIFTRPRKSTDTCMSSFVGRTILIQTYDDTYGCDSSGVSVDDAIINITHNLNKMAMRISLTESTTLYDILWHGDEQSPAIEFGYQFESYLLKAIPYMIEHKEDLLSLNPENGWGNFDSLLQFTKECLAYSILYPNDTITFSR